jgi:hypothetical protein
VGLSRSVALAVVFGACSGGTASKPHVVEDARATATVPPVVTPPPPAGPYKVDATFDKGDVQIRVEWKDVPVDARAAPGRTACGTAKPAAVTPTTTWGIPEVVVMIDANHGKEPPAAAPARIVLEHCALAPRVVVGAATSLIVASAADVPAHLALARLGSARPLAVPPAATATTALLLPVAGHEAVITLEPSTIVELRSDEDAAIAIAAPSPYYAITEANGQTVVRDVPVGTFDVAAWLPARAGQPARFARGKVTVTSGALAEVTLSL